MAQTEIDRLKKQAAWRAVELVEPGMVVGLGAGSTAAYAVRRLAQLLRAGQIRGILGVPCSSEVETLAGQLGIPLTSLEECPAIDITIDGADEVDPNLDLIKGGGGALLREKIVAQASRREVIVVDETKLSDVLGTRWAVPVEVVPFGWRPVAVFLESLGAGVSQRCTDAGEIYCTDQGNWILDARFGPIERPAELARRLKEQAGVVEHGLFLELATDLIVASCGGIRHLQRDRPVGEVG